MPAIMLDGADCWAARRQGLASASGAGFDMIAVAKAATVPFRIPAIAAIPLTLPRGGMDAAGRARAAADLQRRRERSPSLRESRCSSPSPQRHPPAGLQGVARWYSAYSPFMCRRHRHFVVDPAESVRARMSLVAQTEGAR